MKLKKMNNIKQENQIIENIVGQENKIKGFKNFNKKEKILIILAGFVSFLLILLFLSSKIITKKNNIQQEKEIIPTPTPIAEEIILESVYATDSAVIKLENDIKNTKEILEKIDTSQKDLSLPSLDMQINLEN
jgi:hypothetical protein